MEKYAIDSEEFKQLSVQQRLKSMCYYSEETKIKPVLFKDVINEVCKLCNKYEMIDITENELIFDKPFIDFNEQQLKITIDTFIKCLNNYNNKTNIDYKNIFDILNYSSIDNLYEYTLNHKVDSLKYIIRIINNDNKPIQYHSFDIINNIKYYNYKLCINIITSILKPYKLLTFDKIFNCFDCSKINNIELNKTQDITLCSKTILKLEYNKYYWLECDIDKRNKVANYTIRNTDTIVNNNEKTINIIFDYINNSNSIANIKNKAKEIYNRILFNVDNNKTSDKQKQAAIKLMERLAKLRNKKKSTKIEDGCCNGVKDNNNNEDEEIDEIFEHKKEYTIEEYENINNVYIIGSDAFNKLSLRQIFDCKCSYNVNGKITTVKDLIRHIINVCDKNRLKLNDYNLEYNDTNIFGKHTNIKNDNSEGYSYDQIQRLLISFNNIMKNEYGIDVSHYNMSLWVLYRKLYENNLIKYARFLKTNTIYIYGSWIKPLCLDSSTQTRYNSFYYKGLFNIYAVTKKPVNINDPEDLRIIETNFECLPINDIELPLIFNIEMYSNIDKPYDEEDCVIQMNFDKNKHKFTCYIIPNSSIHVENLVYMCYNYMENGNKLEIKEKANRIINRIPCDKMY